MKRPYKYEVGSVVILHDPVEKVGISGKLRRKWVGPFTISWLNSHSCRLLNHVTGKVVNNLVHINRIKPYFYRDETPEDPEGMDTADVEEKAPKPSAQQSVPKEVLAHPVEKKGGTKRRPGRPRRNTKPTAMVPADIDDVFESPADGVAGETRKYESAAVTTASDVAEGEVETPTPDYDTMYAAECIPKQRSRKGERREFLVRWIDPTPRTHGQKRMICPTICSCTGGPHILEKGPYARRTEKCRCHLKRAWVAGI